ncbi:MAG: hypothetical protein WC581_05720 [Thermodesulfovibrionales bacterium]
MGQNDSQKKNILKILFSVCIVLIIGVIGAISTKLFISDNLDSFKGDERKAAMEAMIAAEIGCLDHPVARLLNQKVRLEKLETVVTCPKGPTPFQQNYHAVLQTFSFFGIPMQTITITCEGVICRN